MAGMEELYSSAAKGTGPGAGAGAADSPMLSSARQRPAAHWSTASSTPMTDTNPPFPSTTRRSRSEDGSPPSAPAWAELDRYVGAGLGIAGLVSEYLLSHPFVVLRRQCQVNMMSMRTHATPFTLVPVMVNLNRWQGASVMWKGLGSTLIVRGVTIGAEDLTSKLTPWPKEIDSGSSMRMIGQHLLLKAVAVAVVTPFFSASLVETVQSEIASERPGTLDVFKEGLSRLLCWSGPSSGRMLPVWVLAPPTVLFGVAKYVVATVAKGVTRVVLRRSRHRQQTSCGAVSKPNSAAASSVAQYHDQISAFAGCLASEALLYPVETVLHRMHIQGCRTIVDNLDSGRDVVPIMTRYEGFFDCLSTILQEEGASGLFKGFGALVLQYGVTFMFIKFSAVVATELVKAIKQDTLESPPPELLAQAAIMRQQQQQANETAETTNRTSATGTPRREAFAAAPTPPSPILHSTASPGRSPRKKVLVPSEDDDL